MNSSVFLNYLNLKADKNHTHPEYEGGGGGSVTNVVTKTEYEADKIVTNELIAKKANIEDLKATNAEITNLKAENAVINNLVASKADIIELDAQVARIENLYATKAEITELEAVRADINILNADSATINNLLAGNLTAGNIQAGSITSNELATGTITAGSGVIADGAIGNAQISKLSADKLEAGTIDTSKVVIQGSNGHMRMRDNRFQVFEGIGSDAFERVSLGDVNGDGTAYGFRVRGKDGTTILYDENGVREEGITDGAITNEKISNSAEIDGAKLNIASVINKINEDGTGTIEGFKVSIDGTSLDTKLERVEQDITEHTTSIKNNTSKIEANEEAIKLKVSEQIYQEDKTELTSQLDRNTSSIEALQGEIALKVEQTHIENAKSEMEGIMDSKVQAAKGEIKVTTDSITQSVTNLTQTTNTKADKTTVNTLSSKVGTLETSVNGIKGTVSNLETTTNTLEDDLSSTKTQLTQAKSQLATLDVNLKSITQRVSNTESTVSNVSTVADSKAKIFTSQPIPPYKLGDIWVQGVSGEIMKCRTARASGNFLSSDWDKASKYTDDTSVNTLRNEYNNTKSQVAEIVTDLDGITQRVSDTETTTSNLSDEISGIDEKVTSTNNKVASIETNLGGITQRVSNVETKSNTTSNDLSNLKTTVTSTNNKVASIETNLNGITQRVSNVETKQTTTNNNIASLTTRMNTAESKITDSSIINTVSSTIDSKVNTGISNINIGNRNFLLNGNFATTNTHSSGTNKNENIYPTKWSAYNGGVENATTVYHAHIDSSTFGYNVIEFNESDGSRHWKAISQNIEDRFVVGGKYRISTDIYVTGSGAKLFGGFYYTKVGGTATSFHSGQYAFSIGSLTTNSWKRLSCEVPYPTDVDTSKSITFYMYGYGFDANTILYLRNVSLNQSTQTTDWTPAPEDVQGQIDTHTSQISTTNNKVASIETNLNGITSRVSNVETKQTTANNNISSLTTRMNAAESKITNSAIINTVSSTIDSKVNTGINNIQLGGTNLLKASNTKTTNATYMMKSYNFGNTKPVEGVTYTITLKGQLGSDRTSFVIYNSGGNIQIGALKSIGNGLYTGTFAWRISGSANTHINVYQFVSTGTTASTIEWIKLEKGNKATDWTPAPEDISSEITSKINTAKSEIKQTTDSIQSTVTNINNNYASKSQLTQTVNDFEYKFQQSKANLLYNSSGRSAKLNPWWSFGYTNGYGSTAEVVNNQWTGYESGFCIRQYTAHSHTDLGIAQTVSVTPHRPHTLIVYVAGHRCGINVGVTTANNGAWVVRGADLGGANGGTNLAYWHKVTLHFTPTESQVHVRITMTNSAGGDAYLWAKRAMLVEGTVNNIEWSPNPSESMNNVTNISRDGIIVSHDDGSYSMMNGAGFQWFNGNTGNRYHSLMYGGEYQCASEETRTVTLPAEFRGKPFKVISAVKRISSMADLYTHQWPLLTFHAITENINHANGTFNVYASVRALNYTNTNSNTWGKLVGDGSSNSTIEDANERGHLVTIIAYWAFV